MYEYRECGLDNIKLVNGYTIEKTPYGEGVAIEDIPGLHRAIGEILIRKPGKLAGKEFRFLRIELGLSQKRLAALFETTEQNIGRWERGDVDEVPGPADRLARVLYSQYIKENSNVSEIIERLCELDRSLAEMEKELTLSHGNGWGVAA